MELIFNIKKYFMLSKLQNPINTQVLNKDLYQV